MAATVTATKKTCWIVQQGVWNMIKESMPLAAGYLKAAAQTDPNIAREFDIKIFNFGGIATCGSIAQTIFRNGAPDVLALSVLGWNFRTFGALAQTYKELNPKGLVIFGGTHVANQADRVFRTFPDVDVLVNGEGEFVFREILQVVLRGERPIDLSRVPGVSYRNESGWTTTGPPVRIANLDDIPSPFITGAIELTDPYGEFKYDVALMETNRGCPYSCSFCYWGGAINQKMRKFSRARLREELEILSFHGANRLVLCDSNFGMLPDDLEFIEDLIKIREKFGVPRSLDTSWAKNKSDVFRAIVRRMKEVGLHTSFTLALQTMSPEALESMNRKNMRINEWVELVKWLMEEGLECYAELIWGAPGETYDSFLAGYDSIAPYVSRIATYPLLLMPNTGYDAARSHYGFVTVRGERDDFEYVLQHPTMTIDDNEQMQAFMFWARTIAENLFLRHIWAPLRELVGLQQSQVLLSMARWFNDSQDLAATPLKTTSLGIDNSSVASTMHYLYSEPRINALLTKWFSEEIIPQSPPKHREFLAEVLQYDLLTRPVDEVVGPPSDLEPVSIDGESLFKKSSVHFYYDMPEVLRAIRQHGRCDITRCPIDIDFYYPAGFHDNMDNHEIAMHYVGRPVSRPLEASQPA
jgi:hypothetical protein